MRPEPPKTHAPPTPAGGRERAGLRRRRALGAEKLAYLRWLADVAHEHDDDPVPEPGEHAPAPARHEELFMDWSR